MSSTRDKKAQLQRRVFSRWCSQKLEPRGIKIDNIVAECSGYALAHLLEVLSESSCPTMKKIKPPPAKRTAFTRAQLIDSANLALNFAMKDLKIPTKLPPSAEDIVDGGEGRILGFVWALMSKYMKFEDSGPGAEQMDLKQSLIMWVNNKLKSYGITVTNMGKDWRDGRLFCALIHKFRPKLIGDFAALESGPDAAEKNIKLAFDSAQKYFELDPYLAVEDIKLLDEKSMLIYVSEYFYGIARMRKVDLAARRICKLIDFTQLNDEMKVEYETVARELRARLDSVKELLGDRTIDNTMAGAKKRLEDFTKFKSDDKGVIITQYLAIEGKYNHLAMRLADHKRPAFVPADNLGLSGLQGDLKLVEEAEQERNTALHAELNRQTKLVQLNAQHEKLVASANTWSGPKLEYLSAKEDVTSSGSATYHINRLGAVVSELNAVKGRTNPALKALSDKLAEEKYEFIADVQAREATAQALFEKLASVAADKGKVLDDDLARETFNEDLGLQNTQHTAIHGKLSAWAADKKAYLETREEISSLAEAKQQRAILDAYHIEKDQTKSTNIPGFEELGQKIISARYKTEYSESQWPTPEECTGRETEISELMATLDTAAAEKAEFLAGALAKEQEKERLRLEFASAAGDYQRWVQAIKEETSDTHFGFTLEEVEASGAKLTAEDAAYRAEAAQKAEAATQINDQAIALGVTDNIYTDLTVETIAGFAGELDAVLGVRSARYEETLARERANDALCKEFAGLVNSFAETVEKTKKEVTESTEELEAQLGDVESRQADTSLADRLPAINEMAQKITEAGVTDNRHTYYSAGDIQLQLNDYNAFLDRKRKMLLEAIEQKKLRGMTQKEMDEIEQQFHEFDLDSSNVLEAHEVRACMFSLGDEKTRDEVQQIIKDFGNPAQNGMELDGFKEFMISMLGDSDTVAEYNNGFKLINKGADVCTVENLTQVVDDAHLKYFTDSAPARGDDYDYAPWIDTMFAR